MLAAAEAVIEALGLGDREGGRLLPVKRTQPEILATTANQTHVAPYDLDQRQSGPELLK
jgi:hypothetical protein